MARNKTKICFGCQRLFEARRDAKTCSARCRKRYQRAKSLYSPNRTRWVRLAEATNEAAIDAPQVKGAAYAK